MPIDTRDWYKAAFGGKSPRRRVRPSRVLLALLIPVCVGVIGYSGYLLFTQHTNSVTIVITFAAAIVVLVWNISALRPWWRVRAGTIVGIFLVIALLGTTTAAFAGIEPMATYKDNITDKMAIVSPQTTSEEADEPQVTYQLHGTYTGVVTMLGMRVSEITATFEGDTVTFYNWETGKQICEYAIPGGLETGREIQLRDVVTGRTSILPFKYIAEYDCFVITYGDEDVTYYRE